ncbi:Uncharacterised protein [uncultured archaeon]|nr:Uncharacterised protein [uncultured archaeon]
MKLIIVLCIIVLMLFGMQYGQPMLFWAALMLLLADILGGYVSALFSFIWDVLNGLFDTGKEEYAELEATKTKYVSGKKFIEDGLGRTGKAVGKGEKAKADGKRIKEERQDGEIVHTAASDFLTGLGKIFKK